MQDHNSRDPANRQDTVSHQAVRAERRSLDSFKFQFCYQSEIKAKNSNFDSLLLLGIIKGAGKRMEGHCIGEVGGKWTMLPCFRSIAMIMNDY